MGTHMTNRHATGRAGAKRAAAIALAMALLGGLPALALAVPEAGAPGPAVLGRDMDGEEVTLASLRGKVVVVSFWATWCGYCLKELPVLYNIQRVAGSDRLQVVAVNVEARDVYRRAARKLENLKLLFTHDNRSLIFKTVNSQQTLPTMLIIDRDGRVAASHVGYGEGMLNELADQLNAVLAKPAGAPAPGRAAETAAVGGP